jgi:beta-glucanase (GH16 family)
MKGILCCFLLATLGLNQSASAQFKKLVWSEEFNYNGLPDSTKWGYDVGGEGWGNNELEYYTSKRESNARVEEGHLVIEARKEDFHSNTYTSARLVSKHKGDWKYGKIVVRAKLPHGKGTWPAIWMLPTDWKYGGWPKSGEIDIMEFVGYMPDSIFGSAHTESFNHILGTQSTKGIYFGDLATAYHEYAIEWTPKQIRFLVDGKAYHQFNNNGQGPKAWPFDEKFHLILNLAVGGNWGGKMGVDAGVFPQQMLVDWVRVYQ